MTYDDIIAQQKATLAKQLEVIKARGGKIDATLQQRLADAKDDQTLLSQRLLALQNAAMERAMMPGSPEQKQANAEAAQWFAGKRLDIAVKSQDMDQKQKEAARKEAERTGINALLLMGDQQLGAIHQHVDSLFNIASTFPGDTKAQKDLEGLLPMIKAGADSMKVAMQVQLERRGLASPENMNLVNDWADRHVKSMTDLYAGDASNYAINKRTYEDMKNAWNLNDAQAMPMFSRYKNFYGIGGLAGIMGNLPSLPEVAGYKTSNSQDADEHMAKLAQILTGATNVKSYTEAQARALMPGVVAATAGNAKDILVNKNDKALPTWANGYRELTSAAGSLTPGAATEKELKTATGYAFNPYSRVLLDKMIKNPETAEAGKALAMGSAASAEQTLINFKHLEPLPGGSVVYKGGAFVAEINPGIVNQVRMASPGAMKWGLPANPAAVVDMSGAVIDRAKSMNQALDHVVELQKYNDGAKGIKPIELRDHFADNKPLPTKGEGENATKLFRKEFDLLAQQVKELPNQVQNDPQLRINQPAGKSNYLSMAHAAADQYGIPKAIFEHLIDKENKDWNPTQKNVPAPGTKGSSAAGLLQITKGTAEYLKVDPLDPQQAIDGGARYLKELHDKTGKDLPEAERWRRAVRMYGNTAPSNFAKGENDPAYQKLIASWDNVLNQTFQGP